jgi:hypothetical protein
VSAAAGEADAMPPMAASELCNYRVDGLAPRRPSRLVELPLQRHRIGDVERISYETTVAHSTSLVGANRYLREKARIAA